ncbi:CACTA en-spm transposon protein [Cucumis melo var. makuwa]|uniref:CACTA en-spm transposon protein n=1 Tax=Cucumis melo var. makuwa TaxID=1194695 RepID=A0A5D3BDJ1_CUCMM|nr:CACTA en-spm transposon protein [Cucumis melo var. makuwa]TYJ96535.1 CACTA en-spm transposon protein [Cucumis melo var. makuwa]
MVTIGKCIWEVLEVNDVDNEHLNALEIVVNHQVDEQIEDDTLCRTDVDPTIVERPVVYHFTDDFIDDVDEHLYIISLFLSGFDETNVIFLEFAEDLDNFTGGLSSVDDNSSTSQPSATSTPRGRAYSRLLKLERYVVANG